MILSIMSRVPPPLVVATFYSEGPPHDKGLALSRQYQHLANAFAGHCDQFHGFSVRQVRSLHLKDGTRGANYVREYSAVAGYLRYPNTGYNTIGFGAFKPFIILYVLERLQEQGQLGGDLAASNVLFMDCNVLKHWNLAAYAPLAAQTTEWLLRYYGKEGVAMPRENPSTRHEHICSDAALSGMESRWSAACGGAVAEGVPSTELAHLPSPHSNRLAVRAKDPEAAAFLRLWLAASHNESEYLPSPVRPGGRWHTPEQCSYGLIDACRHGRSELWFEYFFTPKHARLFNLVQRPLGGEAAAPIPVARTRTPPEHIAADHRWGQSLSAVAKVLKLSARKPLHRRYAARDGRDASAVSAGSDAARSFGRVAAGEATSAAGSMALADTRSSQTASRVGEDADEQQGDSLLPREWSTSGQVVDACLAFPRLARRCPGVLYRTNGTHWNFERLSRPFVARAL